MTVVVFVCEEKEHVLSMESNRGVLFFQYRFTCCLEKYLGNQRLNLRL